MTCPKCGTGMNHHADRLVERVDEPDEWTDPLLGGVIKEVHTCPACGTVEFVATASSSVSKPRPA